MKKSISLLTFCFTAITLLGCNQQGPQLERRWTKSIDADLYVTCGEYYKDLPVLYYGSSYTSENKKATNGVNYTQITVRYEDTVNYPVEAIKTMYRTSLLEADFSFVDNVGGTSTSFKQVSDTHQMVVNFTVDTSNKKTRFKMYVYVVQDKTFEWPSEYPMEVLGEDIPHYEDAEYYQGSVQEIASNEYAFEVDCFKPHTNCIEEYNQILKDAGYIVRSNTATSTITYNAVHNTKLIDLTYLYDIENEVLAIMGFKAAKASVWPEEELKTKFNGLTLPVYVDPAVTYTSGDTLFPSDLAGGAVSYYSIINHYAPSSCLLSYNQSLVADGWSEMVFDDFFNEMSIIKDDPSWDWPLFFASDEYSRIYKKTSGGVTHYIECRYYTLEDETQRYFYSDTLSYPQFVIIVYC